MRQTQYGLAFSVNSHGQEPFGVKGTLLGQQQTKPPREIEAGKGDCVKGEYGTNKGEDEH